MVILLIFLMITIIVLHRNLTGQRGNGGTDDVEIMVPLRYLINFEIRLQLKWSRNCIIVAGTTNNQNSTFQINDTKLYVPVVTLSTEEKINLLKQLESGFKRTINSNKYPAKTTNQTRNRNLDYLNDPNFHGVNRPFVLLFKDDDGRESNNWKSSNLGKKGL